MSKTKTLAVLCLALSIINQAPARDWVSSGEPAPRSNRKPLFERWGWVKSKKETAAEEAELPPPKSTETDVHQKNITGTHAAPSGEEHYAGERPGDREVSDRKNVQFSWDLASIFTCADQNPNYPFGPTLRRSMRTWLKGFDEDLNHFRGISGKAVCKETRKNLLGEYRTQKDTLQVVCDFIDIAGPAAYSEEAIPQVEAAWSKVEAELKKMQSLQRNSLFLHPDMAYLGDKCPDPNRVEREKLPPEYYSLHIKPFEQAPNRRLTAGEHWGQGVYMPASIERPVTIKETGVVLMWDKTIHRMMVINPDGSRREAWSHDFSRRRPK